MIVVPPPLVDQGPAHTPPNTLTLIRISGALLFSFFQFCVECLLTGVVNTSKFIELNLNQIRVGVILNATRDSSWLIVSSPSGESPATQDLE